MIIGMKELGLIVGALTHEPALTVEPIDLGCLTRNIYHEARDQGLAGMVAVGYVTTRRLDQGRWGSTLCEVVEAPNQFSWFSDGKPDAPGDMDAYRDALHAAIKVLTGRAPDVSNGASHYFAPALASPAWAECMIRTASIGGHAFLIDSTLAALAALAPFCAPPPPSKPGDRT